MDWIHCNVCFVQPGTKENHRFLITSCGHIYCVECAGKVSREKCQICERAFETTELNSEMTGDIRDYFQDPMDLINKAVHIASFQQGHRSRLISRFMASHLKYNPLKAHAMAIAQENRNLQKKLKHAELERGWYENQMRTLKQKINENRRLYAHPEVNEFGESPAPSQHQRRDAAPSSSQYFFNNRSKSQLPSATPSFSNASRYRSDPTYSSQSSEYASPPSTTGAYPQFSSQSSKGSTLLGSSILQSNSLRGSQSRFNTPSGFSTPGLLRNMNLADRSGTPRSKRL